LAIYPVYSEHKSWYKKVYHKFIDCPEHRNLSGINKAGETKNLYVSDYLNRSAGYLPASDHKQNAIQIVLFQHRVVVVVRSALNSLCRPSSACKYFIGTWIDNRGYGFIFGSDYPSKHTGYFPASDHKQNAIQIMDARSVSFKGSIELPESPAISPMAYNTHNKYVLVAAKDNPTHKDSLSLQLY
jgi:hypothetical protein